MANIAVRTWGGANQRDQHNALIPRSHVPTQQGFQQGAPIESPNTLNMDYTQEGIKKRLGSASYVSPAVFTTADEELIRGISWRNPASNAEIEILVSNKSIYTKQSGSFVRVNVADGVTAYEHAADVSKVGFESVDGHLVIGPDGANKIQVYKSGADLDDQLNNHTATTAVVDVNSNLGQAVLSVSQTSMFVVHDHIVIDRGGVGDGEEFGYVASISDGVSVTLTENLTITHTAATGDSVEVKNDWEAAYTSSSNEITGLWGTGYYLLAVLHSRLFYTAGNTIVEWTPMARTASSGVWDLAGDGSGSAFMDGVITMLASFLPHGADATTTLLYFGTGQGMALLTGVSLPSDVQQEMTHTETPLNHQAFFKAGNWLVYLTEQKNIKAVNGMRVIDLGARLRRHDKSGFLDNMSVTDSQTNAWGCYNEELKKGMLAFSSASGRINDSIVTIDFKDGEPIPGEQEELFERRVKVLPWQIIEPDNNDWFIHAYQRRGDITGIIKTVSNDTADLYTLESGTNDLGNFAIQANHRLPWLAGRDEELVNIMQFLRNDISVVSVGNWPLTVRLYKNYDTSSEREYTFQMVNSGAFLFGIGKFGDPLASPGVVRNFERLGIRGEALQIEFENNNTGQSFTLINQATTYEPGALKR